MGLLTGTAEPPQGKWVGNEFIFPRFDNRRKPGQPIVPPAGGLLGPIADTTAPGQPMAAGLLSMPFRDGSADDGRGDLGQPNANPGQAAVSQATTNAAPAPTGVVAGLPSLPDFVEAAPAPAAPTAPANQDLAVAEVDPQGPSGLGAGKGKSGTTNASPAAQAAAAAAAAGMVGAVDKGIAADQAATGKANTSMTDAVAAGMAETAPGIGNMSTGVNMNDQDETGGVPSGTTANKGIDAIGVATKGIASQVDAIAAALGGIFGGLGTTSGSAGGGLGGADGVGGPGAGGMGSPGGMGGGGSGAPGGSSDGGPGSWRTGGGTGGDRDGRLEPIPAVLHEGEFVQKPEAVSYYGDDFMSALNERRIPKRAAMGLLRQARTEEGPKTIRRGLLGI